MRGFPAVTLLSAFEAAARHLSFTRAADELNVQQPAISRQIAALEDDLGTQLFVRTKPTLTLTPAGEALFSSVSSGFQSIRTVVDDIRDRRRKSVLVVNMAIGFANYFLMPRLAEFQGKHPEIELELVTRDQNRAFDPKLCDVAVVFGTSGLSGCLSRIIVREELCAVCAPGTLKNGKTLSLEELPDHRLLHLTSLDHQNDWEAFLAGTQIRLPQPMRADRFTSFMVYLHAVQNGNGIALGWSHITDGLIATKRLRLAMTRKVKTARGYHCSIADHARDKPEARTFLHWITGLVADQTAEQPPD